MIGRRTVINGVLLGFVALLAVFIGRTLTRSLPPVPPEATARHPREERREPKDKAPERTDRADRAEQLVSEITAGDLFDPSRQPAGTATAAVEQTEVPPPTGIELVGVRLFGEDQEAFIRDQSQAGGAQRRVRVGDDVAGHTVQQINATSVELLNPNGQTVTLWLQLASSGPARAGAPGRPATPTPRPAPGRPGGLVAGQRAPATPPSLDPRAAARQRRREQRLQQQRQRQQGGQLRPNLPAGVRERLEQMRKGA